MVEISQSFKIEIEAIDADHRRLVEIINEITLAIDEGRAGDCEALVPNFVEFSLQHFEREEALLAKHAYPLAEKHRAHHANLNEKMKTVQALAKRAGASQAAAETLRKELVFILMDDVINEDLAFKSFLLKAEAGQNAG
jgi:hemerythrin-like metal-binding protein